MSYVCSIDGCDRIPSCRGWCRAHYERWRRHGDPLMTLTPRVSPERFWERTATEGDCVVWTGTLYRNGYGCARWDGKGRLAHRLAFFLRMGRWPDGILRHLCNNRRCVLHVVEGTYSENTLDSVAAGTHNLASKTHCVRGHEFTEANTRRSADGRKRWCRTCDRMWHERETEKKRAARLGINLEAKAS